MSILNKSLGGRIASWFPQWVFQVDRETAAGPLSLSFLGSLSGIKTAIRDFHYLQYYYVGGFLIASKL